jgi:hypothetical protein
LNPSAVELIGQVVIGLVSLLLQTNETACNRYQRRRHRVTQQGTYMRREIVRLEGIRRLLHGLMNERALHSFSEPRRIRWASLKRGFR